MPIEVDLPDGGVAEFPDGTHPDVMKTALAKKFPAPASNVAAAATDAAWQAPQGFNRGLDATINAPYNIMRAGANFFGADLPEAKPIFGQLNSGVEPKGATGRIAGSVGEAVGSSVAPAGVTYGLASRAAAPLAANAGTLANVGHNLLQGVRAAPVAAAGMDLASATGSGTGVGLAREANAGPVGEFAASVLGGLAPASGQIARSMMQLRPQAQQTQNALLDAGKAEGIGIPRSVASGDTVADISGGISKIPIIGTPIGQSYTKGVQDVGERASAISANLGSGDRVKAGVSVGNALKNWVKGESADITKDIYQEVDRHITNPDATRPLTATQQVVADMQRRQGISTSTSANPAIKLVQEAIERPGGLTYAGIKELRTDIGARMSGQITPEAGTSQPALKRLYGALSDDLRATVQQQGGDNGLAAYDQANNVAKVVARRREQIAKVIGIDANAKPEAVADAVLKMASNRSTGDLRRLVIVRQAAGEPAWQEMQSLAVAKLGRNKDGQFSSALAVRDYGEMSNGGKTLVFGRQGETLRDSMDNLNTISRQFDRLAKKFPTGSSANNSMLYLLDKVLTGAAAVGAAATVGNPALLVPAAASAGGVVAGRQFAKYLGNPSTAKAVRAFSQAALGQVRANSQATAAALQSSVRELARELAKSDGSNPTEVEAAIKKALSGQSQSR